MINTLKMIAVRQTTHNVTLHRYITKVFGLHTLIVVNIKLHQAMAQIEENKLIYI